MIRTQMTVAVVCGGTTSPIAYIEGIDLVTEGVMTLNRTLKLLEQYTKSEEVDEAFFKKLEEKNGAAMLTRLLIEGCTDLHLFVGRALNSAYQNTEMSFNLGIRQSLVDQIQKVMEDMGKRVVVTYY